MRYSTRHGPAGAGDYLVTLTDGTVAIDRLLWEDSDYDGHTTRWRDHEDHEIVAYMDLPRKFDPRCEEKMYKSRWWPTNYQRKETRR